MHPGYITVQMCIILKLSEAYRQNGMRHQKSGLNIVFALTVSHIRRRVGRKVEAMPVYFLLNVSSLYTCWIIIRQYNGFSCVLYFVCHCSVCSPPSSLHGSHASGHKTPARTYSTIKFQFSLLCSCSSY